MRLNALRAYNNKLVSPGFAAMQLLRKTDSEQRVVSLGMTMAQPTSILRAMNELKDKRETNLVFYSSLLEAPYEIMREKGVTVKSDFWGVGERELKKHGANVEYLPVRFKDRGAVVIAGKPDTAIISVSSMDEQGFFSLGTHAEAALEIINFVVATGGTVIVEANASMPYTLGVEACGGHRIHVNTISYIVEYDKALTCFESEACGAWFDVVSGYIAELIPDGATLQVGIGSQPALHKLLENKRVSIHTEIFGEELWKLVKSGMVDNKQKGCFNGVSVATAVLATNEVYSGISRNESIRLVPVKHTNDPALISLNPRMRAINRVLEVDLNGSMKSHALSPSQHYSGIGGVKDFDEGARASAEGASIFWLPSTYFDKREKCVKSTIVPRVSVVTLEGKVLFGTRYIATEFGVARITQNMNDKQVAEEVLKLAHPDFRSELRRGLE